MATLHMGQERFHGNIEALCGARVDDNLTWEKPFVTCWKCVHLLMGRPIPPEPKTPEHDKLKAAKSEVHDATQLIGEFIEWLVDREGGALVLAERKHDDKLYPFRGRHDALIADFFGINEQALSAEKEALLNYQRAYVEAINWVEKVGRPCLSRP